MNDMTPIEAETMPISDIIKKRRSELGMTQGEVAEMTGIPLPTYRTYERGGDIPFTRVEALANKLDIDAYQLLPSRGGENRRATSTASTISEEITPDLGVILSEVVEDRGLKSKKIIPAIEAVRAALAVEDLEDLLEISERHRIIADPASELPDGTSLEDQESHMVNRIILANIYGFDAFALKANDLFELGEKLEDAGLDDVPQPGLIFGSKTEKAAEFLLKVPAMLIERIEARDPIDLRDMVEKPRPITRGIQL